MIKVRQATYDDLPAYLEIQQESWGNEMAVNERKAKDRFNWCLEGILVAEVDGVVVGATTMIRLASYDFAHPLTWDQATGEGWCNTHDPKGSICFGVDLSATKIHPRGTVDALMAGCMQLVIKSGVKYCILGGRMLGYQYYLENNPEAPLEPEEYLWMRTDNGRYLDREVNMYSKVPGLRILGLIPDYFDDPASLNYGVLLRWRNPFYRVPGRKLFARVPLLGYDQWQKLDRWWRRHKR